MHTFQLKRQANGSYSLSRIERTPPNPYLRSMLAADLTEEDLTELHSMFDEVLVNLKLERKPS